jgi:hypothetical protein
MATVYNWVISQMDEVPQDGSLLDVVVTVNWRRNATTEIDGKVYIADVYGAMACATPSPTDFTAYPDLTFEQVCGWLDAGLDVPALNTQLDAQLANSINPPIVSLPFPWVSTPTPPSPDTSGTSGTAGTDGTSGTSGI